MSLASDFGHSSPALKPSPELVSDSHIGVEVELEGINSGRVDCPSAWSMVNDGSLRNNGVEFVMRGPMMGENAVTALTELEEAVRIYDDEYGGLSISNRCSVHVHLDIRDMDYTSLFNLIVLYLLCEPIFFEQGGIHRRENLYCVPLAESNHYLRAIGRALSEHAYNKKSQLSSSIQSGVKYSAFNIAPVTTQGSVEFRHHQGEYRKESLLSWINMILSLKNYAMGLGEDRITTEQLEDIICDYPTFIETATGYTGESPEGHEIACRTAKLVCSYARTNFSHPMDEEDVQDNLERGEDAWAEALGNLGYEFRSMLEEEAAWDEDEEDEEWDEDEEDEPSVTQEVPNPYRSHMLGGISSDELYRRMRAREAEMLANRANSAVFTEANFDVTAPTGGG